ncbi:MAG: hypothetical protein L6R40_008422 [Gallowayella cf. fulva]|nr:MAG: hypothetical protein L6R40_008422 [Xanthomendoza cf. fulva]
MRVNKRGWPKGKPRKGCKKAIKAQKKILTFMDLPLEIRRHLYEMVLPQQDVPKRSKEWATIVGNETSFEFMDILLVNKQVSDEARSLLYGTNRFTIVISAHRTLFLGSSAPTEFHPFPTSPSLPYIKNWQIALWPETHDEDGAWFSDAVLSACAEIAMTPDLQTLRLAIPCLCSYLESDHRKMDGECNCQLDFERIEDIHTAFIHSLAPFNLLRFKGDVQLLTTPKPPIQPPNNQRAPRFNTKGELIELSEYAHPQCQKAVCRSFAASFTPFTAMLMGKTTPNRLTQHHMDWLNMKIEIAKAHPEGRLGGERHEALTETWHSLNSGPHEHFFAGRAMTMDMVHYLGIWRRRPFL